MPQMVHKSEFPFDEQALGCKLLGGHSDAPTLRLADLYKAKEVKY